MSLTAPFWTIARRRWVIDYKTSEPLDGESTQTLRGNLRRTATNSKTMPSL